MMLALLVSSAECNRHAWKGLLTEGKTFDSMGCTRYTNLIWVFHPAAYFSRFISGKTKVQAVGSVSAEQALTWKLLFTLWKWVQDTCCKSISLTLRRKAVMSRIGIFDLLSCAFQLWNLWPERLKTKPHSLMNQVFHHFLLVAAFSLAYLSQLNDLNWFKSIFKMINRWPELPPMFIFQCLHPCTRLIRTMDFYEVHPSHLSH